MVSRFLILFAALLLPAQALAQASEAEELEGSWALRIDDATIFVFTLDRLDDGRWQGQWMRPERINSNGWIFREMEGAQLVRAVRTAERDGVVQLVFTGPLGDGRNDVLRFRQTGTNQAELTYVGVPTDPYPLIRVPGSQQLGPFDEIRIYDRDNAVTEADYTPDAESAPDDAADVADDARSSEQMEAEADSVDEEAQADSVDEQAAPPELAQDETLIGEDFLEDLDNAPLSESDAPSTEAEIARACTDIDRDNPPDADGLSALWGDDYESIGTGLDIREYRMDNGDIARITLLDDRIYVNSCGEE
ncbi:hypothetical protein [Aurantiacibacter gangjinensis]|uniref:Uncharacterized protein n=1 Tax=Aurantiacibacter gangjinensis TaxID=502682 RepID=A0A0G9MM61_9SPHN|nr:hypothetical protein [Aurantiacibacter gangjinensis]APE27844.1 hypothetical protein BMF35_a1015 [Aurantiacibacter gangjinensis]KLE31821.1 hypothetical protein AAW01_10050 [Aurantiacibacter gangjinensis]